MTRLTLTNIFAIFLLVTVSLMMTSKVVNSSGKMRITHCWWDLGCANGNIATRCKKDCKKKHGSNDGFCNPDLYNLCCCFYESCY